MKKITKQFLYVIFLSLILALVTSCGINKPKPASTNGGPNQSQQTKTPDKTEPIKTQPNPGTTKTPTYPTTVLPKDQYLVRLLDSDGKLVATMIAHRYGDGNYHLFISEYSDQIERDGYDYSIYYDSNFTKEYEGEYITDDMNLYVKYSEIVVNTYTVTFLNPDDSIILVIENVQEGTVPSYTGDTPTFTSDDPSKIAVFDGWDEYFYPIYEDTVYHARYYYTTKELQVKLVISDDLVYSTKVYYGNSIMSDNLPQIDLEEGYYIDGWYYDKDFTQKASLNNIINDMVVYADIKLFTTGFLSDSGEMYSWNELLEREIIEVEDGVLHVVNGYLFSTGKLVISKEVVKIADRAFMYSNITSLYFEEGSMLTEIGSEAFRNSSLRTVVLPEGLTTIKECAFYDCSHLENITLPNSLVIVEYRAIKATDSMNYNRYEDGYYLGNEENPYLYFVKLVEDEDITNYDKLNENCKIIGCDAFSYYSNLTSITLPNGLVSISSSAFYYCTNLSNITIPGSVKYIGSYTFNNCESLTSITLPSSLTYISDHLFYYCTNLRNVNIPSGVKTIGDSAFYNCMRLNSVVLPEGLESIEYDAFQQCYGLTTINIPNGIERIASGAFGSCDNLNFYEYEGAKYLGNETNNYLYLYRAKTYDVVAVTVHKDCKFIGGRAFYNCNGLKEISIPTGVKEIGIGAFSGCSSLESITLPEGIEAINIDTFSGCSSLKTITLPSSVKIIGENAFAFCRSIMSITIGENLEDIEYRAFQDCTKLVEIYNLSSLDIEVGKYGFGSIAANALVVHKSLNEESITFIEDGYAFAYDGSTLYLLGYLGDDSELVLPSSVTRNNETYDEYVIYDNAFLWNRNITSIVIPDSVTYIGEEILSGAENLVSITIPFIGDKLHGKDDINRYPFGYLFGSSNGNASYYIEQYYYGEGNRVSRQYLIPYSLKEVIVTGSSFITQGAFYGCKYIETIKVTGNIEYFELGAFDGCESLENFIFLDDVPAKLKYIGGFSGCEALKSITIPKSVLEINSSAFDGCDNLETIIFEEGSALTLVGANAFSGLSNLKSINLPSTVKTIGNHAFDGCVSLYIEDLPESLTTLGEYSFKNCTSLRKVTIPQSLTSVNKYAFYGCSGIASLDLGKVTEIKTNAFAYVNSLKSIIIPQTVSVIGDNAFYGDENLMEVYNLSNLNITVGSTDYGYVASYAKVVHKSLDDSSIITIVDGFEFYLEDEKLYLIGYKGSENEIILPSTVTVGETEYTEYEIKDGAFKGVATLTKVVVPESVTRIGRGAFMYCKSLESLTLPFIGSSESEDKYLGAIFDDDTTNSEDSSSFYVVPSLKELIITGGETIGLGSLKGANYLEILSLPFIGASANSDLPIGYAFGASAILRNKEFFPESIKKVIITKANRIPESAFSSLDTIEEIVLPSTVTVIGRYAFSQCIALKSVSFGENTELHIINEYAFYKCESLESIVIPKKVESLDFVFAYCTALKTVTFEEGSLLNELGEGTFYNCQALESFELPENVTAIGKSCFESCYELKSFTILGDDKLTSIPEKAFKGCRSLKSIVIPKSVQTIANGAFNGCYNLESITLPFIGSKRYIESDTFQYTFGYIFGSESYNIPNGSGYTSASATQQYYIANSANNTQYGYYYIPTTLKNVTITDNGYIQPYAFYNCKNMTITLPESFSSMGKQALTRGNGININLTDLESFLKLSITNHELNPLYCANKVLLNGEELTSLVIPEGITTINQRAFYMVSCIKELHLPSTLVSIGDYAFYECNIETIEFSNDSHLESIGKGAFYSNRIKSLELPSGLLTIDKYAFEWNNDTLTYVSIPASVQTLGDEAFANNGQLKDAIIDPDCAITVMNGFNYCLSLRSIVIPKNVTQVSYSCFDSCYNLCEIYNLSSVEMYSTEARIIHTSLEEDSIIINQNGYIFAICGENVYLIGYDGNEVNLTFPSSVSYKSNTYNSYKINLYAFMFSEIESATLSSAVTAINRRAFYNSKNLKSIVIPSSVTIIDDRAFEGCEALESATLNEGLLEIGSDAFSSTALKSIVIPNSVTTLGENAFDQCSELVSATIGSGITTIPEGLFFGCVSLEIVILGDNVTSIGEEAFEYCMSLETITLGNKVSVIFNDAFRECSSLVTINMPETLTSIGEYAFYNCTSLKSIVIPEGVTALKERTFANCLSLESITLPSTLKTIGRSAFSNCKSLKSVTLPEGLESIGNWAFDECESLESIKIPDGIVIIPEDCFYQCYSLKNITLGSSLTTIQESAFSNCTSLKTIVIPNGVTIINGGAFSCCESLESITLPASLTTIGQYAFNECASLKSIVIPDGVKTIGYQAFGGCTSLESVVLPAGLSVIEGYLFYSCTSLKNITLPSSVTTIGSYAFRYCWSLEEVTLNEGLTTISNNAFYNCKKLKQITLPSTLTSITSGAFDCCYSLVEIYNLSSLDIVAGKSGNGMVGYYAKVIHTSLGEESILVTKDDYLFSINEDDVTLIKYYGDDNILVLPSSITYKDQEYTSYDIAKYAFEDNLNIISVTVPEAVTYIDNYAFYGCYKLVEVINKSSLSIYLDSTDNGYIGCYALNILEGDEETNVIIDDNGFILYNFNDELYLISYIGDEENVVIPEGVNIINNCAFAYNRKMKSIDIPSSVKKIKDESFKDTKSLKKVIIHDIASWCTIDNNGNLSCPLVYGGDLYLDDELITEIVLPKNVRSINSYAFYGCTSLEKIVLNEGLEYICDYAFYGCTSLKSIDLPSTLKNICYGCFNGCNSLEKVIIHNLKSWCAVSIPDEFANPLYYAHNLYLDDELLVDVVIPEGITEINRYVFAYTKAFKTVTLPSTLTMLGIGAFYSSGVTTISIPEGVTTIAYNVFAYSTIESIVLPESLKSVNSNSFDYCSVLEKVYYMGSAPYTENITVQSTLLKNATWFYFTLNGDEEAETGSWWYYDQEGNIVEKIV